MKALVVGLWLYTAEYSGGPQHTFGPIRHFPLGVQILLGALIIALSFGGLFCATHRFFYGGSASAFVVVLLGAVIGSVIGAMIAIGGLVAL